VPLQVGYVCPNSLHFGCLTTFATSSAKFLFTCLVRHMVKALVVNVLYSIAFLGLRQSMVHPLVSMCFASNHQTPLVFLPVCGGVAKLTTSVIVWPWPLLFFSPLLRVCFFLKHEFSICKQAERWLMLYRMGSCLGLRVPSS